MKTRQGISILVQRSSLAVLLIAISALITSSATADTIAAASCSATHINAAIATSSDGDTVLVPEGTCTWNQDVVISGRGITLRGAGVGRTVILNGEKDNRGTLLVSADQSHHVRITGFTFDLNDTGGDSGLTFMIVSGGWTAKKVRIDHCDFVGHGNWAYLAAIQAQAFILVDHCEFTNILKDAIHFFGDGANSWAESDSLGTDRNHFVEDCVIRNTQPNSTLADAYVGARYVIRHTTFEDSSLVNHGNCTSSPGVRHYEIYNNAFRLGNWVARGWVPDNWMFLRGGTGVVFDNVFDDLPWGKGEVKMAEYKIGVSGAACGAFGPNWCCCDYPCVQQIGRGRQNELNPLFFWQNDVQRATNDGVLTVSRVGDDSQCEAICNRSISVEDYLAPGRDYYTNQQRSGYQSYPYPHPLVSGEEEDVPLPNPPTPPTNLHVSPPPE